MYILEKLPDVQRDARLEKEPQSEPIFPPHCAIRRPNFLQPSALYIQHLLQCPLSNHLPMDQLGKYAFSLFLRWPISLDLVALQLSRAAHVRTHQMEHSPLRLPLLCLLWIRGGGAEALSHRIFVREPLAASPRHQQKQSK